MEKEEKQAIKMQKEHEKALLPQQLKKERERFEMRLAKAKHDAHFYEKRLKEIEERIVDLME